MVIAQANLFAQESQHAAMHRSSTSDIKAGFRSHWATKTGIFNNRLFGAESFKNRNAFGSVTFYAPGQPFSSFLSSGTVRYTRPSVFTSTCTDETRPSSCCVMYTPSSRAVSNAISSTSPRYPHREGGAPVPAEHTMGAQIGKKPGIGAAFQEAVLHRLPV